LLRVRHCDSRDEVLTAGGLGPVLLPRQGFDSRQDPLGAHLCCIVKLMGQGRASSDRNLCRSNAVELWLSKDDDPQPTNTYVLWGTSFSMRREDCVARSSWNGPRCRRRGCDAVSDILWGLEAKCEAWATESWRQRLGRLWQMVMTTPQPSTRVC